MQTPESTYFEPVREILVDQLGISADDVHPESDLIADLGADSLDTVEIVMALEAHYDVEVPDELAEKLTTVNAITAFLEEKLGPGEDSPKVAEPKPERKMRQDMTFGEAIEHMQQGGYVARAGWNGKGMYLWLLPGATIEASWCKDPHLKALAESNGGKIDALPSIRMLTADRKILTGWLASQSDMLARDWQEVRP